MPDLGLEILQALSPLLLTAVTWVVARLDQFIRTKVQNEYLKGVLLRLDDAVLTVVKGLQQSVVDEIKAAQADGKITDDEKKQIKERRSRV